MQLANEKNSGKNNSSSGQQKQSDQGNKKTGVSQPQKNNDQKGGQGQPKDKKQASGGDRKDDSQRNQKEKQGNHNEFSDKGFDGDANDDRSSYDEMDSPNKDRLRKEYRFKNQQQLV
jgi:hypothetical protein